MALDGKSINQIMRSLGIGSDQTLRRWIKTNRPDLMELILKSGSKRKFGGGFSCRS